MAKYKAKYKGHIPRQIIDDIRQRADIVSLVSQYVKLRRSGKNYMAPCPFHKETKPSFSVNPHSQSFHCFGCGAGGNVFSFIMMHQNLAFPEAVRHVAELVGVTIPDAGPEFTQKDREQQELRDQIISINEKAASFFQKLLWEDSHGDLGRQYLERREIDKMLAERFRIGLAPPPWTGLWDAIRKKGIRRELLIKSGLFVEKEGSNKPYDRFRSRLIFPTLDHRGQVVGFAGRTLEEEDVKYINTPETEVYKKRRLLFGLFQAGEHIRESRRVIITEGYVDVMMLHKHGFGEAVATCGTALTEDHLARLRRYTRNVVLLFDGDEAGVKAAFRSLEMLVESDFDVRVCVLPQGLDPDEFLRKKGAQAMKKAITDALQPFPFIFTYAKNNLNLSVPDDVMQYLDIISPFLLKIADPVKKSMMIIQAAGHARVDATDLRKRLNRHTSKGMTKSMPAKHQRTKKSFNDFEHLLLRLIIHYPSKLERWAPDLREVTLNHSSLQEFMNTLISLWEQHHITRPDQWVDVWGVLPYKKLITRLCTETVIENNINREIQGCILKLREKKLKKQLTQLQQELTLAENAGDEETIIKLLREINTLSNSLNELRTEIAQTVAPPREIF